MSHCLTAPNPKLLGYSVTSNMLIPAPTTHREWPGRGNSTARLEEPRTKRSLIPCAQLKGSTHITQCKAASSAACRSRDQKSGDYFVHFFSCMAEIKGCRMKDTTSRKDGGLFCLGLFFFFHLELQLQTHARKLTLEGWRRNKTIKHHRLLSMDLASLQGLSELRLTRIYGILETVSTFSWL